MSNIIKLENINEELARGLYGDIECIIMKSNDYINISKLCKHGLNKEGNPKRFSKWLENSGSEQIIDQVYEMINGIKRTTNNNNKKIVEPIYFKSNFQTNFRGYYVHPIIAIAAIIWIDIDLYFKLNILFTELYKDNIN